MSNSNRELTYLEFNLLYGRIDNLSYWRNIKFENNRYTGTYSGLILEDLSMYLHKLTMSDNINGTSDFEIIPLTLSEIYEKYEKMRDTIELFEENSMNYRQFLFHKLTHRYYLKYLTDQELLDYEHFINNKIQIANQLSDRVIEKVRDYQRG